MDFFTSLWKTYEAAEVDSWVDNAQKSIATLLPIYHNSMRSNGKNIISVQLDKTGQLMKATFLDDGETIIFPVTSNSVARSGKNPPPHPLVDKLSYFVAENNQGQYEAYHNQLENWREACQNNQVKEYLTLIQQFILRPDFLDLIYQSLYREMLKREGLKVTYIDTTEKEKTVDLSSYFLDFRIDQFIGQQNVSVTNFIALHQAYITYVESNQEDKIICNISGKKEVLATKHRGLLGNAKLISVSNNSETYKGRFKERDDVFTVGNQTSEKIHLMAKFLLENDNTHTWLGAGQHLINWFSDDPTNQSQLKLTEPQEMENHFDDDWEISFDEDEPENRQKFTVGKTNRVIGGSFIHGTKQFSDTSTYYVAILNKTNDGRIALKYFRHLQVSELLKSLEKWQSQYTWEVRKKDGIYFQKTPSFNDIILAAYGVDRDRYLELDNDSFRSDQYQQLVTALIDGNPMPSTIVKKLETNIKQRQKYPKHWSQVQQISLAILHKQYGREFKPMLDHENTNRSYLFGRLLAIFELMESKKYEIENPNKDKKESNRITNAERYWNAYTSQPAKLMMNLTNKIKPYEEAVRLNAYGIFHKLDKERAEIVQLLSPLMAKKDINDPLDYQFIFGYYAEKQFFYTKQEKNESESEE